MKIISAIQTLSLICLALCTLCILGAEPGVSESSMYEYEHAFDTGHVGWYLGWGWIVSLGLLTISTILIYHDNINNDGHE